MYVVRKRALMIQGVILIALMTINFLLNLYFASSMDAPVLDVVTLPTVSGYNNAEEVDSYQHLVDELSLKIEEVRMTVIGSENNCVASYLLVCLFFLNCYNPF